MTRYKFAFAIRKYAATGGDTPDKRKESKELLGKAHDAAMGIAIGLPVGTTTVGALGGAGTGYLLGKAFGKDAKQWGIGGALAGGGIGFGAAAPFSTLGLVGAHESSKIRKAIEKQEKKAKVKKRNKRAASIEFSGSTMQDVGRKMEQKKEELLARIRNTPARTSEESVAKRNLVRLLERYDYDRAAKNPGNAYNQYIDTLRDMRTESLLKGVGIPAVSGLGGAAVGAIGGNLLGRAFNVKNPGLWGGVGGLLGAGAGLGISIPLTSKHRADMKYVNDALGDID